VTGIRFHINTYATTGSTGYTGELGVIREFDVIGGPTAAVPEPATAVLALLAAGGFGVRRRRR
jgi:hypothetical protein